MSVKYFWLDGLLLLAILSDWHLFACHSDTGVEVCDLLTDRRRGGARWKGSEFQRWHWHDRLSECSTAEPRCIKVFDEEEEPHAELESHE
ncbi:hypothetical protein N7527_002108 [Penicillium freii]|nr:hypothetical protein N7527_002108 [Penicillium freii]